MRKPEINDVVIYTDDVVGSRVTHSSMRCSQT
jgi:hypothetical protein